MNQPLTGRRILVTRGASQAPKLSDGLRELGAIPIEVPILEIVAPESYESLDGALRDLAQYDWLIVTSGNTVRVLVERAAVIGISLEKFGPQRVGAVGAATEKAAHEAGLSVTLTPKDYSPKASSLPSRIRSPGSVSSYPRRRRPGRHSRRASCRWSHGRRSRRLYRNVVPRGSAAAASSCLRARPRCRNFHKLFERDSSRQRLRRPLLCRSHSPTSQQSPLAQSHRKRYEDLKLASCRRGRPTRHLRSDRRSDESPREIDNWN